MYRKDRAKGGGGVIVYDKTGIAVKRLKLPREYKALDPIALDVEIGENNSILLGLYIPPSRSPNSKLFYSSTKRHEPPDDLGSGRKTNCYDPKQS